MPNPLLRELFDDLQQELSVRLRSGRHSGHPGSQGRVSEAGWQDLLTTYLPNRYCARSAFVVDCEGNRSDQIDLVIHDHQYTPLLFQHEGQNFVPAESVYAVFEVKQSWNAEHLRYAAEKAASVRRLHRTSVAIPHAGGVYKPRQPVEILAGLLASRSDWKPAMGKAFREALDSSQGLGRLDLGCALDDGAFSLRRLAEGGTELVTGGSDAALVFFFLSLLEHLQRLGTVAAIDYRRYQEAALDG